MTQAENNRRQAELRRSTRNYGRGDKPPVSAEQLEKLRGDGIAWEDLRARFCLSQGALKRIMRGSRGKGRMAG